GKWLLVLIVKPPNKPEQRTRRDSTGDLQIPLGSLIDEAVKKAERMLQDVGVARIRGWCRVRSDAKCPLKGGDKVRRHIQSTIGEQKRRRHHQTLRRRLGHCCGEFSTEGPHPLGEGIR